MAGTHLQCGKVYDAVDIRVFGEHFIEAFFILDVEVKIFGLFPTDELNAIQNFLR